VKFLRLVICLYVQYILSLPPLFPQSIQSHSSLLSSAQFWKSEESKFRLFLKEHSECDDCAVDKHTAGDRHQGRCPANEFRVCEESRQCCSSSAPSLPSFTILPNLNNRGNGSQGNTYRHPSEPKTLYKIVRSPQPHYCCSLRNHPGWRSARRPSLVAGLGHRWRRRGGAGIV
jgi:hypothetical protein